MRILIVGPAWVGDMVMSQSLYIFLRQRHPGCAIDVLAPAWTRPLLERMPEVRRAIDMPLGHGRLGLGERLRLGRELRAEGYDQAIVLPNSFKSALVPRIARIPRRTGWRGEMRGWLLDDCRTLDKRAHPLMVQRFVALALPPAEPAPSLASLPRPALRVEARDIAALRERFSLPVHTQVLALCPGAEFGSSKKWPAAHYAEVARDALSRGGEVWLLGSANDRESAGAILERLAPGERERCRDFTGRTTLAEAIDLLSLADAVVSNDSGLMHVAAALDRPLVVIYGSSSPGFTPPLAHRVKTLSLGLECSPCFKRECPLGHHKCMLDLDPARVRDALADLQAGR